MKNLVTFLALVCVATVISSCACCGKCSAKKPDCGMQCCADNKTTCATCPTCSPKK